MEEIDFRKKTLDVLELSMDFVLYIIKGIVTVIVVMILFLLALAMLIAETPLLLIEFPISLIMNDNAMYIITKELGLIKYIVIVNKYVMDI